MFRKTAIAALTVAVVATSGIATTTSTAEAKNGKKGAFAAGTVIGLATGAIVAGAARDRTYDRGYYEPRPRHCWDKPVHRWDPYYREYVIVGYRTVCR
ncbi:tyrosyl-tRNA synthetase [Breoghania sp.]|uniref:tyrosyl-tRNA synthetase n=1 Tax=Breoghania sp. TaxID=2065378 RepID=UPI00261C2146|nr:tyrosyl-tRNA synthetase [Breoghania sp.]MDJ0931822.1 tyrosyl-tRNA synthetase [Breoghania sp.]